MTVPVSTRRLVFARDGDECVHCGTTEGLTIQHRANRGMGSSKAYDTPAHLIVMCGQSNQRLESNAVFADLGRTLGWKIRRSDDPTMIPVRYASGDFYFLDKSGARFLAEGDN